LPLELQCPQPVGVTETGSVHDRKKFSGWIKKVNKSRGCAEIETERWQGKLIAEIWRVGRGMVCLAIRLENSSNQDSSGIRRVISGTPAN